MPKRFTVAERIAIVEAHIEEFGSFDAKHFAEVAESENHPAYEWFENDADAGYQLYRVHRARQFAEIKIRRTALETVSIGGEGSTVQVAPMLVSPPDGRTSGGGYVLADSEEGQIALREEALLMLTSWQRRFGSILTKQQAKAMDKLRKELSTPP